MNEGQRFLAIARSSIGDPGDDRRLRNELLEALHAPVSLVAGLSFVQMR